MKANMGTTDRIMRIIVAVLAAILYYTDKISGTTAIVVIAVAAVLLLTSVINFCPLYTVFGISTKK